MTKEIFIKFYGLFESLIKQEVGGEYCMNASCRIVNYCGGYCLDVFPGCLMFGAEIVLMAALADRLCVQMRVYFWEGRIEFL